MANNSVDEIEEEIEGRKLRVLTFTFEINFRGKRQDPQALTLKPSAVCSPEDEIEPRNILHMLLRK